MAKSDKPSVLIDGRLLAYRHGGIPRYAAALAEWLPQVAPDLAYALIVNRPTPSPIPAARVHTPPHFRFERRLLGAELARLRPALVHSTDFISPSLRGPKRVVTIHDLAFVSSPEILDGPSLRYYRQVGVSIQEADQVIAVSQYTADQIRRQFDVSPERLSIIHNGVDLDRFRSELDCPEAIVRRELGGEVAQFVAGERPLVLAVGTIEPRKGFDVLLDVVESRFSRDMSYVIAGQPGWRAEALVRRLGAAQASGRLRWLCDVSDRALRALYSCATLLAIPSLDEGFGLPALEAMAAGLPVVAAAAGALPEVIGEAGVLVSDRSPVVWAEALSALALDARRRAVLAQRGRERAEAFSLKRAAEETAAVYRKALS